ncbi:MAG: FAD-dependent oxidoreductase [bacterium]|nr:FAD-dependent oxidoreductase [bacterium]
MTFTIVGQGLAGTWLALLLQAEGHHVRIVDASASAALHGHHTSSRVAAGILNPLTGQRVKPTWRGDTLIPQARKAFRDFEIVQGQHDDVDNCADPVRIWRDIELRRVFRDVTTQQWFEKRMQSGELATMRITRIEAGEFESIHYPHGGCIVHDAAIVDVPLFLDKGRAALLRKGAEVINAVADKEGIDALPWKTSERSDFIVWCIGIDALKHPLWSRLTLEPSKGEILEVQMSGEPMPYILNRGHWIAPLMNGNYLIGATNDWDDHEPTPTDAARKMLTEEAEQMTGRTLTVVDHRVAIRPSTLRKRPLIGRHPIDLRHVVLTGLGTKGCQLAPWAAKQLVNNLLRDEELDAEVDILQDYL